MLEEDAPVRAEGSRPPNFRHVYTGKFKDRNNNMTAAGILTYAPGDNVEKSLRQTANSAPIRTSSTVDRFSQYFYPNLGEIKVHYGRANDPKYYEDMAHGMRSDDKSFRAKDCVNPKPLNKFENLRKEMSERIYHSHKSAPLGKVPMLNMPKHINPYTSTFGIKSDLSENAKECINPDKPRHIVELEASKKHDSYVFSHDDYEPGEHRNRQFPSPPYDRNERFGVRTEAFYDGRMTKKSLSWLPLTTMDRRNQNDSKLLNDFREKHTSQLGQALDPNKETRFLGQDHVFGLTNTSDQFGAGDVVHGRPHHRALKGKEKERAYLASVRSHLARYNFTKFKTLVDAFKFYDKDKDGLISKIELKVACALTSYPVADDLLDALFAECDHDADGKINFLEFCNFLCYKDSMNTGLKFDASKLEDKEIKDDEGRILLRESDLAHKNNVAVNELVPRTLVNQIDSKVGTWKTTYDIINEAPFRAEPLKKRVYGVPSIRNDIVAPTFKKIQDKTNYGNDGNAWSLLSPSVFSQHGVYESDVLKPRSKDEIDLIFKKIGYEIPPDSFEAVWNTAKSQNPYGEVSVEEFRSALDLFTGMRFQTNQKTELVCA